MLCLSLSLFLSLKNKFKKKTLKKLKGKDWWHFFEEKVVDTLGYVLRLSRIGSVCALTFKSLGERSELIVARARSSRIVLAAFAESLLSQCLKCISCLSY